MSSNELVEQIMAQVIARVVMPKQQAIPENNPPTWETAMAEKDCSLTEFIDAVIGDTVGPVIVNVDSVLLDAMELEKRYHSIGIPDARTGAGPHIMAADKAVKATNIEVVSIELPRGTKGGAGRSSLIVLSGNDVSDVKRGIEVALKGLDHTFGDVYTDETGHIEMQCTICASYALEKAFDAPTGRACGAIVGTPAFVDVLMTDTALKSANMEVVTYSSPAHGTSFSNEATLVISGDSGAVRQAVISARKIGKTVLGTLGSEPKNDRLSYT